MQQNEPRWLVEGRKYIGQMEIKGPRHNPLILQFWKDIKRGGIKDDETPWCAAYGCVVVFSRDGGGHVGFVVGLQQNGDLMVLGGNQSDAVNIRAFSRSRVSGYRWPVNEPKDTRSLPITTAPHSVSEA